jgi:hypothetical protein
MGIALEGGKLSSVAWLGRHGGTASRRLKAGLVALVAVLMMLNAIGAYGFLAKAHIGHALASDLAVSGRAAAIDTKISVQADKVADLSKQIADLGSPHWSRRRDSRGQWRRPPPPRSSRWCPADTTDFRPRFQSSGARSASKWCF